MVATQVQNDWVGRVLGLTLDDAGSQQSTVALWRDAKETIDHRVATYQKLLRATNYDRAIEFADRVLPSITQNMQVRIMVSLMNYDTARGADRAMAGEAARKVVGAFRAAVESDPLLPLLDKNSLLPLGILPALSKALTAIEAQLNAATG